MPTMKYTDSHPRRIRRPRNAFFIYKHDLYEFLRQEGYDISNQMMFNTLAGKQWRELNQIEQGVYYEKADQEKREHEANHPGYRYRPTRRENPRKGKDMLRGPQNDLAFSKSQVSPEPMGRLQGHSEYNVAVDTPQAQVIPPMDPDLPLPVTPLSFSLTEAAPSVQATPCYSNLAIKGTGSFSTLSASDPFAAITEDTLSGVCDYDEILVSIIEECYLHFVGCNVAATTAFHTFNNNLSLDPIKGMKQAAHI